MKKLSNIVLTAMVGLASVSVTSNAIAEQTERKQTEYNRIVAMSPDVADIIVALGGADKVVGKNAVNRNPALKHAKAVGRHRNLTAEAVIELKPDLALGSYMVQPQSVYQRLNSLGVKAVNVAPKEDVSSYASSIVQIGEYIGKEKLARKTARKWLSGMSRKPKTGTRYLLSYDGRHVAGRGTVGDVLIKRAGGINAASSVSGLKPMSREGWLEAKPDVIIIAEHNIPVIGSKERFVRRPEVAVSPAGKNQNVLFWSANDYLRYGLNTPEVVDRLHKLSK